jgi:hypothetical protein
MLAKKQKQQQQQWTMSLQRKRQHQLAPAPPELAWSLIGFRRPPLSYLNLCLSLSLRAALPLPLVYPFAFTSSGNIVNPGSVPSSIETESVFSQTLKAS